MTKNTDAVFNMVRTNMSPYAWRCVSPVIASSVMIAPLRQRVHTAAGHGRYTVQNLRGNSRLRRLAQPCLAHARQGDSFRPTPIP